MDLEIQATGIDPTTVNCWVTIMQFIRPHDDPIVMNIQNQSEHIGNSTLQSKYYQTKPES